MIANAVLSCESDGTREKYGETSNHKNINSARLYGYDDNV